MNRRDQELGRNRARGGRFQRGQDGYALLVLLLVMALIVIASAIIAPSLAFEIRRDREEELIHRGVQYSRAIRNYSAKTGRFPLKLEDLQDTNGVRYIRKLYKDPITGGDFRLLHMSDMPSLGGAANLNPGQQPGANPLNPNAGAAPPDGSTDGSQDPANSADPNAQDSPNQNLQNQNAPAGSTPRPSALPLATGDGAQLATGGVIFGVVSKSKLKTIREFEHKNHYNQWLFFYYPPYGGNRELTGPTPTTMTGTAQPVAPGAQPAGMLPGPGSNGPQAPGTMGAPVQNDAPAQQ